ncbi:hypothetical protein [Paraferrimonas sp. SM1919]|uniref:hypothetical protein n=1 Tax=Paraferrimonas sp. SM1919 TaxID=2662263 RepID=UPI001969C48E|nr:hypothetical protein [Paraferrimonas sp. SM1919]
MAQNERKQILNNGWRQGATCEYHDFDENDFQLNHSSKERGSDAKLMLITQGCDLLNSNEPFVECLLLRSRKGKNKNLRQRHGFNPREIEFQDTNGKLWVARAYDHHLVKRSAIIKKSYNEAIAVSSDTLAAIKHWKANRYIREGLPEEFDSATKSVFSSVGEKGLLNTFGHVIHSIRIYVKKDSDKYQCAVIILHRPNIDQQSFLDLEHDFETEFLSALDKLTEIELLNRTDFLDVYGLSDVMDVNDFPLGFTTKFPKYFYDPKSAEQGETEELNET